MLGKITGFLLDKSNHRFILLFALIGSIFITFTQCNAKKDYKQKVQMERNNIEALGDSVRYYENKAGQLTAEKMALQTSEKRLEKLNTELKQELEKEEDNVEYLTKINAELKADTTQADSTNTTELESGEWKFDWNLSRQGDQWKRVLEGYTEFKIDSTGIPYNPNTQITKDLLNLSIITGIRDDDGKKQIFVRSTYPNLNITNIQGAILEQPRLERKPSRFGIGPSLGGGYTLDGFQPFVGITLNYNLIRF